MNSIGMSGLQASYRGSATVKHFRTWQELLWAQICDYCEKTTLHGYRYLTEPGRHWVERLIWVIIQVLATWGVLFIILDVWKEYINSPTVTTVDSMNYPIWKVPFPAVAICNINKISRSAAQEIAKEMSKSRNVSEEKLLEQMRYLGRLYDHDSDHFDEIEKLHNILSNGNKSFDVSDMMKQLTPKCEELLVRCRWKGKIQNCSHIFTFRKTMEGYCCSFNYIRETDDFNSEIRNVQLDISGEQVISPGYHMGLTVLVNPQSDDYFYPLMPSYGTKVLVFNPRDFPDTSSGGLIEKLVPPKNEVFFRLEATTVYAVSSIQNFDWKQRGCLFPSEGLALFGGYYSYSDCIMNCRIQSIHILCHCLPFYYPRKGTSRNCGLLDIPCLNKYREKWSTLRPTEKIPGLEAEMEDSITCEACYPSCSDTAYHVQTAAADLVKSEIDNSGFMSEVNITNHSILHLFFGSKNSLRLKQDVLYYWYDLLSNFGGICGLFVGFSLISVVEFVYFFTLRLFFVIREPQNTHFRKETDVNKVDDQNIYWREVVPRRIVPRY